MGGDFNFIDYEISDGAVRNEKIAQGVLSAEDAAFLKIRSEAKRILADENAVNPFGEIFYRQGKILEFIDTEYNEDFIPEFYSNTVGYTFVLKAKRNFPVFHPCYQDMTDLHLRYYLWWRSEFRNGAYRRTTVPYLKLYAFELVNRIGGLPPKKTLSRLIFLWKKIHEQDRQYDYFMLDIIRSFYCVNVIEDLTFEDLLKGAPYVSPPSATITVADDYADIYKLCAARLSSKKLGSAFVMSRSGHYLAESLPTVFRAVEKLLSEDNIELKKLLLGAPTMNAAWKPFRTVPYYSEAPLPDRRIELSTNQWIICSSGKWYRWAVLPNGCCTSLLDYLYRVAEAAVRKITRYTAQLRPSAKLLLEAAENSTTHTEQFVAVARNERLPAVIFEAVSEYLKSTDFVPPPEPKRAKKAPEPKPIVIPDISFDFSKLDEIRSDADYISEKLKTEDDEYIEPAVEENDEDDSENYSEADGFEALLSGLSETHIRALKICLSSDDSAKELAALAREKGTMPSVVIEEINTPALDLIGDILIEGDPPTIIEDYADELKAALEQHPNGGNNG